MSAQSERIADLLAEGERLDAQWDTQHATVLMYARAWDDALDELDAIMAAKRANSRALREAVQARA